MEVHFTPEQEAQLTRIASSTGSDPEALVTQVAVQWLEEKAHIQASVYEGILQAERGEFLEESEMDSRFEAMLRSS